MLDAVSVHKMLWEISGSIELFNHDMMMVLQGSYVIESRPSSDGLGKVSFMKYSLFLDLRVMVKDLNQEW